MKVLVKASILRDCFNKIFTVVDKKNSRPILTYCMITATSTFLELVATDIEVYAKIKIQANILKEGSFCINAKNFYDILKEMPSSEICLEMDDTYNILRLNCKDIKFSLLISSTEEFPHLHFENNGHSFVVNSFDLQQMISSISYAMPYDETRTFLNGIFLHSIKDANGGKEKLRAVATDTHRLALIDVLNLNHECESLTNGIIIPRKGVSEIKKLTDSYPGTNVQISVDDSFIYLSVDEMFFLSVRLITREYPQYQFIIPTKTMYKMIVKHGTFITAVKRIKTLASEKSNGVKFLLTKNNLILSANRPSLGDATERIEIDYQGKDIEIAINAKYLVDTISVLEDEEINFEFNNERGPILVKSNLIPNFLGIIMPLKI